MLLVPLSIHSSVRLHLFPNRVICSMNLTEELICDLYYYHPKGRFLGGFA